MLRGTTYTVAMDPAGLLLILLGISLVVLELKVPSFGLLGLGGVAALVMGTIVATRDVPGMQFSLGAIVPAAIALAVGILLLGRLAMKAQRKPAETGVEAMINQSGRARTPLAPGVAGQIDARGEIWTAVSRVPIAAGDPVRIAALQGLTMVVEPLHGSSSEGAH